MKVKFIKERSSYKPYTKIEDVCITQNDEDNIYTRTLAYTFTMRGEAYIEMFWFKIFTEDEKLFIDPTCSDSSQLVLRDKLETAYQEYIKDNDIQKPTELLKEETKMKIYNIEAANMSIETLEMKGEKVIVIEDIQVAETSESDITYYRRVEYDRDSTWHEYKTENESYNKIDDDAASKLEVLYYEHVNNELDVKADISQEKTIPVNLTLPVLLKYEQKIEKEKFCYKIHYIFTYPTLKEIAKQILEQDE